MNRRKGDISICCCLTYDTTSSGNSGSDWHSAKQQAVWVSQVSTHWGGEGGGEGGGRWEGGEDGGRWEGGGGRWSRVGEGSRWRGKRGGVGQTKVGIGGRRGEGEGGCTGGGGACR